MNLDEVVFEDVEENGLDTSKRGLIGKIGARQLGYNLTVVPPGKAQRPFHNHRAEEEMFLILDGEGELRLGDRRYPLRRHDMIAGPAGGPDVARQIVDTGTSDLRYLALSTLAAVEVCEFPDSGKPSIRVEGVGAPALRRVFRADATVGYYDREDGAATEAAP
jgi:uncharacterized cupin superfamily protein